jgi:hypothetical protein
VFRGDWDTLVLPFFHAVYLTHQPKTVQRPRS